MSFRINHNVSSINALRNLGKTESQVSKSLERLSSGLRVNRGADDPAGLVISESMRSQIVGIRQAIENAETATAMMQTAEGAMNEIHNLLNSIRQLSIHAANAGANDSVMLSADQDEIDNAIATIDRIANQTQFGVKKLLDGSCGMSGSSSASAVTYLSATSDTTEGAYIVDITTQAEKAAVESGTAMTAVSSEVETLTINGVNIVLASGLSRGEIIDEINTYNASTNVTAVDDAANTTIEFSSDTYGSSEDISVVSNLAVDAVNHDNSGVGNVALTDTGVDIAGEFDDVAGTGNGTVLSGAVGSGAEGITVSSTNAVADAVATITINDNSLVFQVGANKNQTVTIAINALSSTSTGTGVADNMFANLSEIEVITAEGSQDAIEIIDKAIQQVSAKRGEIGVFQKNTLESSTANLAISEENLVAAESIIRDTDFAKEMAAMTKNQILLQSGTAMLSQANQIPQVVLQLLK